MPVPDGAPGFTNPRELTLISVFRGRWASVLAVILSALVLASACASTGGFSVAVEGAQASMARTDPFTGAEPVPTSVFIPGASRARQRTTQNVIEFLPTPTPTAGAPATATAEPAPTALPTLAPTAAPIAEPTATETPAPTATEVPTAAPTAVPAPAEEPASSAESASTEELAASSAGDSALADAHRVLVDQQYAPFATIGSLTLVLPSLRVEHVGFHQAIRAGAQQMTALDSPVPTTVMESRGRGTGSHTAADIVVEPGVPIVAPVTGVVLAANSYVLYCEHDDAIVVIEPDGFPGWEAKVLHISGLTVAPGDRVVAGQTVIANGPTVLPFESQVDDHTHAPAWPHVHIETVDTSIPHESNGGSCP